MKQVGGDTRATRQIAIRLFVGMRRSIISLFMLTIVSVAQSTSFGQSYPQFAPVTGGANSPVDIPKTNLTPVPRTAAPAPVTGGNLYDPYTIGPSAGTYAPAAPGIAPTAPTTSFPGWLPGTQPPPSAFSGPSVYNSPPPTFGSGNPGFNNQALGQTGYGQPGLGQPSLGPPIYGQPIYGQQPFGTTILPPPGFPPEAYPSNAPTTLFPGGFSTGGGMFGGGGFGGSSGGPMGAFRLMQGPKLQHGWLRGGDGDKSLDMNETDVAVSFAFPNFLHSGQPVYVTPAFGLTLLSGPHSNTGADLPGQVYSGTLTTDWQSDPIQIFSVDLGLTVGMFSDFDTNISDSFRVLGRGLAHFRLTPYTTLKGGVHVINRNKYTVLPAIGLLYSPTPMTRYDIFFPEPKLSQYFTTLGTQDVWAYVGGEYGGGSWTVERQSGVTEQVDINDIRVNLGIEWGRSDLLRQGRRTGFAEFGYVFARELEYKSGVGNIDPNDTFMVRVGIGY